jgi:virginiamycin B lyase
MPLALTRSCAAAKLSSVQPSENPSASFREDFMSRHVFLPAIATALLCSAISPQAQQPAQNFPDGPGKETFVGTCGGCHDINRARAGYTPDGWRMVMQMMINFDGAGPKEQIPTLTEYLIKSFPEKQRPPAKIVDGPVQVTIKQYPVMTLGSRPHDPLATRDGNIWYTGQLSGKLGRVEPKTGLIKEYPLKTPHTGPHGLVEDKEGNIWFTGNHAALIGKLDPATGNVTEYKMPDPKVKDPHSLSVAPNGVIWFTAQQSNAIGRVDPGTGEVKLVQSPTPRSRPYGILVSAKGVPVFCMFGTNKLATIDPKTMEIKEYALPHADSRPRRIALDGDEVWYADFSRGYLGRYNLVTGAHKEWLSPSGPQSQPYGIVLAKGAIWYNESYAKPNTIVRFDPKTETFQTWAIPGGGDIVRKMDVTPDGNPVTANSLVNQVGLVEVK